MFIWESVGMDMGMSMKVGGHWSLRRFITMVGRVGQRGVAL
jgi:hypothetical protein